MNRGIIFSLDAVLALILVMILAATIAQNYVATSEIGNSLESVHARVADRAVIDFYSGQTSSEEISSLAEFGECVVIYTIDPEKNGLTGRATPDKQVFCEEEQ